MVQISAKKNSLESMMKQQAMKKKEPINIRVTDYWIKLLKK